MYDARLNLCRQVAEDAKEYFGAKVFSTPIPRNVRLAEAPSFGKPILLYDPQSVGAKSYLAVAEELLRRIENPSVTIEQPAAEPAPSSKTAAGSAESMEPADGTPEPATSVSHRMDESASSDPMPEVTTHD